MIIASGVDLIEVERVKSAMLRYGDRFLKRVFTVAELEAYRGRAESLAVRFAAKEAAAKALGCGIGEIGWKEIEVLGNKNNAPSIYLYGEAARRAHEQGLVNWSVSLSHTRQYAIALIIAIG